MKQLKIKHFTLIIMYWMIFFNLHIAILWSPQNGVVDEDTEGNESGGEDERDQPWQIEYEIVTRFFGGICW